LLDTQQIRGRNGGIVLVARRYGCACGPVWCQDTPSAHRLFDPARVVFDVVMDEVIDILL
jgi:hypothetical protein